MDEGGSGGTMWQLNKCAVTEEGGGESHGRSCVVAEGSMAACRPLNSPPPPPPPPVHLSGESRVSNSSRLAENEGLRAELVAAALDGFNAADTLPDFDGQRSQTLENLWNSVGTSIGLSVNEATVGISITESANFEMSEVNSDNVVVSDANAANFGMLEGNRTDCSPDGRPSSKIEREEAEGRCLNAASGVGSSRQFETASSPQFNSGGFSDRFLQEISALGDFQTSPDFRFIPLSAWDAGSDDDEMLLDAVPPPCQIQEVSALDNFREDERGTSSSIFDEQILSEEMTIPSMYVMPHMTVPAIVLHKRAKVLKRSSLSGHFAATIPSDTASPSSSSVRELVLSPNISSRGGSELTTPNSLTGNGDEGREPLDVASGGGDDNGDISVMDNREDQEVRLDLTDDLLHMVFSFLDHSNLCKAAVVCKQWQAASTHEDFWQSLNFENRKITTEQVAQMCRRYPKAVELNVRGAPFVDELVHEAMCSLRNLEVLILGRWPLSDVFFKGLLACPVLYRLSISDALLGGGSQEILVQHDSLRHVQITKCRVIRIIIRCPQLEILSLKRSAMASAILNCPQLRELDVAACHKLSDAGVRIAATSCPLLTSIDMSNCSYVSDETLREIAAACSNLHVLDASYCPNISLEAVRMPMLTEIKLHSCEGINASSMASLSQCFMLEALQLDCCWLLTSVTLDLPRLQNISLVHCRKFVELNLRCPLLSSINVSNCPILNRIDIMSSQLQKLMLQKQQNLTTISLQCLRLREVDLTECESLTNSICKVFSEKGGCPMLNTLILDHCESLTTVQLNSTSLTTLSLVDCHAIINLDLACPNLQQIYLDGCDRLEEASFCPVGLPSLNLGICPRLSNLEIKAPQMEGLELKGCGVLSQASINCPRLLSLDASFCSQLQDDCVYATTSSCPMIESLILMSCPSIGSEGLFALKLLSNLMVLDLSYTFLTNLQPVFETCSRLKVLKLQACKYLMDTSLDALHRGEALPDLCELDLSYGSLCQSAIEKLLAWCPHLTRVSLNGCANMYDLDWGLETGKLSKGSAIDKAASMQMGYTETHQPENTVDGMDEEIIQDRLLENLNCVGCPNIRKVAIPASFCLHLCSLNLSLSNNLKEVDLGCRNLISLNLSNCSALEILKLDCPRLTSLLLQSCGIEEREVESAIKNCNLLETLDVRYCPKISFKGIGNLRLTYPGLRRLYNSVSA